MEFRDIKKQYKYLKEKIDESINEVILNANFISGSQVNELESLLEDYVSVKHCITCANGTDALTLALMAWNIGHGDAIFVPDFTFFASGEVITYVGATPIFVDVDKDTFNISIDSLEDAIDKVLQDGKLNPKVVIAVDLFGQPADYVALQRICKNHNLYLLEDGAQGFGGRIEQKKACSFGDISTTSFFPAKPLGCYGDGGAIFTNNDEWANLIRSYCVHGKGDNKYDNVRIGMNSRLDTIQAAILQVKLKAFIDYELDVVNKIADVYSKELEGLVAIPKVDSSFYSSWAQYSILVKDNKEREALQKYLKDKNIPTMIYYPKPMHKQGAFDNEENPLVSLVNTEDICNRILSLPMHPYLEEKEQRYIIECIKEFYKK